MVEEALEHALKALLTQNTALAYQTILNDNPINRAYRALNFRCYHFIAKHLPASGHLRFISSVLRVNLGLERIGDYAVTICRETAQLAAPLRGEIRREVESMARSSIQMLEQSVQTFEEGNADMARATMGYAKQVDREFDVAFADLLEEGKERSLSTKDLFAVLSILNMLERVSDQAKNICEDTVFVVTGEQKKTKKFNIIFLNGKDDFRGQIATAVGRMMFSASGFYSSAGLNPAANIDTRCLRFLKEHGIDYTDHVPHPINWAPEDWKNYHVIVSLAGPMSQYVSSVPFQTIALEWDIDPVPAADVAYEEAVSTFETIYRQLATKISDLMHTLHGEEAC